MSLSAFHPAFPWTLLVALLALFQYLAFTMDVGRKRTKFKVAAPSCDGPEPFLRAYRVQMNTLEQLLVFLPALLISAFLGLGWASPILGGVYLLGRLLYRQSYLKNPESRLPGFALSLLPSAILLISALVLVIREF